MTVCRPQASARGLVWVVAYWPFAALAAPAAGASQSSFQACPQFFAGGTAPQVPQVARLAPRALCYEAFAVLHAGTTKTPVFVAERLNKAALTDARDEVRTNRFFADARLPRAERAELDDYVGSGYDRGHMAPAGDMPSASAMAQSFTLANMVPQAPHNNRHAWAGIERATRKYVLRAHGDVFVITGPVFAEGAARIGPGHVRVPTYLYKLVYDPATQRSWAHWIENVDHARAGPPISYRELVRRTGIRFLPAVPDSQ
ncbi:DNA/RNA non-specific endonuclease [Oxalobacteraceae bacterium OM1]|nr:DNA/RNA non-specific endonuclease [Oxalobacteraceae bacterium OM1]